MMLLQQNRPIATPHSATIQKLLP